MKYNLNKKLIALLLFITALVNGCMKKPDTKVNYGPESSVENISAAMDKAIGEESPFYSKNQEQVMIESTQLIRGSAYPSLLGRYAFKFINRLESDSQIRLDHISVNQQLDRNTYGKVIDVVNKQDYNCFNKITQEEEACSIYPTTNSLRTLSTKVSLLKLAFNQAAATDADADADADVSAPSARVTFHKFKTKNYVADAPELVKSRPNCEGLAECKINIIQFTFDKVVWTSDNEGEMASFTFEYSKDVPQLARQMNGCVQESIPVPQHGEPNSQAPRVLVTSCETVQDFSFGK
jgi:hypothetical protein